MSPNSSHYDRQVWALVSHSHQFYKIPPMLRRSWWRFPTRTLLPTTPRHYILSYQTHPGSTSDSRSGIGGGGFPTHPSTTTGCLNSLCHRNLSYGFRNVLNAAFISFLPTIHLLSKSTPHVICIFPVRVISPFDVIDFVL